jgi:hypothetical protein
VGRRSAYTTESERPPHYLLKIEMSAYTYELKEIEMSGGQFTWSNNQAKPTLGKLDRFLMTNDGEKMFPLVTVHKTLVTVHKMSTEVSGHNPIILDTLENRDQISRNFKFEKTWLKEDGFLEKNRGNLETTCSCKKFLRDCTNQIKKGEKLLKRLGSKY